MTIIPLMPWIMRPTTSGNGEVSLSMTLLSKTPPFSIHLPSPAMP
jgi:hypothetical protein